MIVTQSINVHLDKHSTPTIETVQSDTGRVVSMTLFNQNLPWTPPAGATGMVRHSIWHDGEIYASAYDSLADGSLAVQFNSNKLTVFLSPEILSIPGVGELQVAILHEDVLVATLSVLLRVQRNIGTQGLSPTAFTDLSHHIQQELVRQFRNVYDQGSWLENLHHRVATEFTLGGLDGELGVDLDQDHRICSDLLIHNGREVTVCFPAGLKVRCMFLDENFACREETGFFEESFSLYSAQPYLRLEAGCEDDGRIQDPVGMATQIGVFYSESFQGSLGALDCQSFLQCSNAGYYRFTQADLANLWDAPDIHTGGILEVFPHGDKNMAFQRLWTSDGQLWLRLGSSPFCRLTSGQISGGEVFTVTLTGNLDECHSDKTFGEILAAVDAGRVVQCRSDAWESGVYEILPLIRANEDVVEFGRTLAYTELQAAVWPDNSATVGFMGVYDAGAISIATPEYPGIVQPVAKSEYMTQSVGVDEHGGLWTAPGGGAAWRYLDTFDLSSGAVSYETDTTGCIELLLLVTAELSSSGTFSWKGFSSVGSIAAPGVLSKALAGVTHLRYMSDGFVVVQKPRNDSDTLQQSSFAVDAKSDNHALKLSFGTATSGVVKVYGR